MVSTACSRPVKEAASSTGRTNTWATVTSGAGRAAAAWIGAGRPHQKADAATTAAAAVANTILVFIYMPQCSGPEKYRTGQVSNWVLLRRLKVGVESFLL